MANLGRIISEFEHIRDVAFIDVFWIAIGPSDRSGLFIKTFARRIGMQFS